MGVGGKVQAVFNVENGHVRILSGDINGGTLQRSIASRHLARRAAVVPWLWWLTGDVLDHLSIAGVGRRLSEVRVLRHWTSMRLSRIAQECLYGAQQLRLFCDVIRCGGKNILCAPGMDMDVDMDADSRARQSVMLLRRVG